MSETHWQDCLLHEDATIHDAIASLDRSALQIAIVTDLKRRLLGTLTDGDIRRALLRGLSTTDPIQEIVNRKPVVVPPGLEREAVLQMMTANTLRQLPVVDQEMRIVGLHAWADIAQTSRSKTMVVMAGGEGRRLRPYTENCPKPMLEVAGKPILEHIFDQARDEGFDRFVFTVRYLAEMVEDHFGDGSRWGVQIVYTKESRSLGTAGALSLLDQRPTDPFVVTNGDVLTQMRYSDMLDFHRQQRAAATMAVRTYEWQNPFGVVETEGLDVVGFREKPVYYSHVNAGIYTLQPAALDLLEPAAVCDIPTLFERLRTNGKRTIVYPMHEEWIDIGTPTDFERGQIFLKGDRTE